MSHFAEGELAFGRSFIPATGEEVIMFSYPDEWTLELTKARIAPDLDLSEFEETDRQFARTSLLSRSLFSKIAGEKQRETVFFKRKAL